MFWIRGLASLLELIPCKLGWHRWPGLPYDHCTRCYLRFNGLS